MLIFNFKYSIELSFSVYINPWSQVQSPCSYINCASQFQVVIFCCLQVSTKLCFTAYMANSTLQIPVLILESKASFSSSHLTVFIRSLTLWKNLSFTAMYEIQVLCS